MGGVEWVVEGFGCSEASLSNLDTLRRLFETLIAAFELRPVGQTQWHQFSGTGGITGVCILAESHLACHTFPEDGSLCLNLFCCSPRREGAEQSFDSVIRQALGAQSVSVRRVARSYRVPQHLPLGAQA